MRFLIPVLDFRIKDVPFLRNMLKDVDVRKLEKLELKIIRLEGHLEFNQACIRNKLLPTYTKVTFST